MSYFDSLVRVAETGIFLKSLDSFHNSFKKLELIIITICMFSLENKPLIRSIYLSTLYSFLFNSPFHILKPLNTMLLFGFDLQSELKSSLVLIDRNLEFILASLILLCMFSSIQLIVGSKSTNLKRKLFHFLLFIVFVTRNPALIYFSQYVLYICIFMALTAFPQRYLSSFKSNKDFGSGLFSHVYLLASVLYPFFFIDRENYIRLLISICIMDSFASFSGEIFKKNTKSLAGFAMGQSSALLAEYIILGSLNVKYHMYMGLIELFCPINDNIALPFAGVVYFHILQRI
jgi:hypothetical protein